MKVSILPASSISAPSAMYPRRKSGNFTFASLLHATLVVRCACSPINMAAASVEASTVGSCAERESDGRHAAMLSIIIYMCRKARKYLCVGYLFQSARGSCGVGLMLSPSSASQEQLQWFDEVRTRGNSCMVSPAPSEHFIQCRAQLLPVFGMCSAYAAV